MRIIVLYRILTLLTVLVATGGPPSHAAPADSGAPARNSASVRIELPTGTDVAWSIEPGERRVVLDLPRGASFPVDFGEASGGFIHDAEVSASEGGGHHVDLTIAAGYLARVEVAEGAVVLTFESRFEPAAASLPDDAYRLGIDDRVRLTVHNQPELSADLTVGQTGLVSIPLVGDVPAAGLSPGQLQRRIADLLGRSYLVDPQVDVAVAEYRSQWVMVTGEVATPTKIPLRGGTRLKEVLSEAGGFADAAGPDIHISRKIEGTEEYETENVTRDDFENGRSNPVLHHGDIVDVPRTAFCYVQGEVRLPNRIPIERGTTLLRALALVGGLTEWADQKSVTIRRKDGQIEEVNIKQVVAGKVDDPVLVGDEIIVVRRRFF